MLAALLLTACSTKAPQEESVVAENNPTQDKVESDAAEDKIGSTVFEPIPMRESQPIDIEPSDWVKYMKPIREYMYYRTQAVLHQDINRLWERYPMLQTNIDRDKGINVEQFELESLTGTDYLDANFDIESNDRIKIQTISEHEVMVLVHGKVTYMAADFEEAGWEFLMEVYMTYHDNQWMVSKTDEYTIPEYKEWVKNKQKQ